MVDIIPVGIMAITGTTTVGIAIQVLNMDTGTQTVGDILDILRMAMEVRIIRTMDITAATAGTETDIAATITTVTATTTAAGMVARVVREVLVEAQVVEVLAAEVLEMERPIVQDKASAPTNHELEGEMKFHLVRLDKELRQVPMIKAM
ncbi:MAG: hypothetical protein ACI83I_001777 [Bacteroidia bacterium]|jgi:hypothetical protein